MLRGGCFFVLLDGGGRPHQPFIPSLLWESPGPWWRHHVLLLCGLQKCQVGTASFCCERISEDGVISMHMEPNEAPLVLDSRVFKSRPTDVHVQAPL